MKNELGVSSVVGVVLLLLLVVLAASVIGLTLSAATQNAVESTPNVQFILSADPQMLYHGGGDILYKDRLKFYDNGVDITSDVSIDSDDAWTEWRTGQAITLPDDYYVANLTIIAVDTLGRDQLLYRGSGVVVTPVPTPTHLPDAAFTWQVDFGSEVPHASLPSWLTADVYILTDEGLIWDWFWPHWGWYSDVEFTAVENSADVDYAWSSTGPSISNPHGRITEMRFEDTGSYSVTLTVTNSYGSNSSTKTFSVRNPGLTAMTWVTSDKTSRIGVFGINESWRYRWALYIPTNTYQGYSMSVELDDLFGQTSSSVHSYVTIPHKNTWYHIAGTYEQTDSLNNLNIYFNGDNKRSESASGALYDAHGATTWSKTNSFYCDTSYEIPFALTPAEIAAVYNSEKSAYGW